MRGTNRTFPYLRERRIVVAATLYYLFHHKSQTCLMSENPPGRFPEIKVFRQCFRKWRVEPARALRTNFHTGTTFDTSGWICIPEVRRDCFCRAGIVAASAVIAKRCVDLREICHRCFRLLLPVAGHKVPEVDNGFSRRWFVSK